MGKLLQVQAIKNLQSFTQLKLIFPSRFLKFDQIECQLINTIQYIRNLTIQKQARLKSSKKQQPQHFLGSFLATNQTALEKRGATCPTGKTPIESTIQDYEGRLVSVHLTIRVVIYKTKF